MSNRRHAFTLVELLIVLALLGLLLAIVLPTFGRAWAISRRAMCQANLTHISQAYNIRRGEEAAAEMPRLMADHWARILLPYVDYHSMAYLCPEDEDPVSGLPDVKLHVVGRTYNFEMMSLYPYWLEYAARDVPGGTPATWKVNEETYYIVNPSQGKNIVDILPQYTPGLDRRVYWFLFDDERGEDPLSLGGDRDLEDMRIRVFENRRNMLEITCKRGYTIYHYEMLGPDGEIYTSIGEGNNGPFFFQGADKISYGMNWQAEHITKGQDKILMLDYETEVCNVGDDAPLAPGESWDLMKAPRHFDKCNVLFASGQIRSMSPDEIDPDFSATYDHYWNPTK